MPGTDKEAASSASSTTARRQAAIQEVLAACEQRFRAPVFDVTVDDTGVVWVRRLDGAPRSIGLQPWLLRTRSIEELLLRVETKLDASGL